MYVGIHVKTNELTEKMLTLIRKVFKDEEVHFFVNDIDETDRLLSSEVNRKMLDRSIQEMESGNVVEVSLHELLSKE